MNLHDPVAMKALYYLQNKKEMDEDLLQTIKDWVIVSKARYPIAVFISVFDNVNSYGYLNNYQNNYDYLFPILVSIYEEVYNEDELKIITSYLAFRLNDKYLSNEIKKSIEAFFNYEITSPEIVYYLNELKFLFTQALIFANEPDSELVIRLLDELQEYAPTSSTFIINEVVE